MDIFYKIIYNKEENFAIDAIKKMLLAWRTERYAIVSGLLLWRRLSAV